MWRFKFDTQMYSLVVYSFSCFQRQLQKNKIYFKSRLRKGVALAIYLDFNKYVSIEIKCNVKLVYWAPPILNIDH